MAQGSQANACKPGSGEVEAGGYWVSLASLSGLLGEFQASEGPCLQKQRWMISKGAVSRFSLVSMQTNTYTHTLSLPLSSSTPLLLRPSPNTHKGKKTQPSSQAVKDPALQNQENVS